MKDPAPLRWLLIALALAFLALFVGLPVVTVFVEAFRNGARAYLDAIKEPDTLAAIKLTLLTAGIAVPLNVVFGVAAAWLISKYRFPGKSALLTLIVLPEYLDNLDATLGGWLKQHVPQRRNTLRFLLPKKAAGNLYYDRDLIVYARAVYLANQWKDTDPAYRPLHTTYQTTHLRPRLRELFDGVAPATLVLRSGCRFEVLTGDGDLRLGRAAQPGGGG